VRSLLAQTGWLSQDARLNFRRVIDYAEEHGYLAPSPVSSLRVFVDVREALIEGAERVKDEEVFRAIDMGLSILRMVDGIPHETNAVHHPGVPVYSDQLGNEVREGVRALLLDTTSPGGTDIKRRVFPTTRNDYLPGQILSWEWDMTHVYEESWYRDPDDGEMKYGWTSSAEFVGRPMKLANAFHAILPDHVLLHITMPRHQIGTLIVEVRRDGEASALLTERLSVPRGGATQTHTLPKPEPGRYQVRWLLEAPTGVHVSLATDQFQISVPLGGRLPLTPGWLSIAKDGERDHLPVRCLESFAPRRGRGMSGDSDRDVVIPAHCGSLTARP
jgi:hypothetical protein